MNCSCGKEITAHEAGDRCLDVLVAQKQGLRVWQIKDGTTVDLVTRLKGGTPCLKDGYYTCKDIHRFGEPSKLLRNYSEDLNKAMEFAKFVIDTLDDKEIPFTPEAKLVLNKNRSDCQAWFDWLGEGHYERKNGTKYGLTYYKRDEALAICIAGLETLAYIEKMK